MQDIILFAANVGYNRNMPQNGDKKSEQVLINLDSDTYKRLITIARDEDRPKGYVARELMIRGLNLFQKDGKLRDDAPVKAKVVATISPGMTKPEVQRSFEREVLVPVHDEGTIGKRASKRKAK